MSSKDGKRKRPLVPRLRFPKFREAGEWRKERLGTLAELHKGKGISKDDVVANGVRPCIRYGELYMIYGEMIKETVSRINVDENQLFLSKKNDVIIPASGETKVDIAKASCVMINNVALGSDINVLRSDQNGVFLSYQLNGPLRLSIAKLAQGDAVVHLYRSQLDKLDILVPSLAEQRRIADCLSSLDERITLEAQKLEALKRHKKGLMQQLFPREGETLPRLRFPEFREAGEWKVKPLGTLCRIRTGSKDVNEGNDSGKYPFFTCADKISHSNSFSFDTEAILVAGNANVGQTKYYSGKFEAYQRTYVLTDFKIHGKFLYAYLDFYLRDNLLKQIQRSAMSYIRLSMLQEQFIPIPINNYEELKITNSNKEEQQKIADCLSSLDELISLEAQKLEALKRHKKGLMQQLFPVLDDGV